MDSPGVPRAKRGGRRRGNDWANEV